MNYGELNPAPENRVEFGFKGKREHVITPNTPNISYPGQTLKIVIPKGSSDVTIVKETLNITAKVPITSKDKSASLVQNFGRNVCKKRMLQLGSNDFNNLDNSDKYYTYSDLHLGKNERKNCIPQGIQSNQGLQARAGATKKTDGTTAISFTAEENAIKKTLEDRFEIPLDFDFFKQSICPYGLKEDLAVTIELNSAAKVLIATDDTNATYNLSDISLEYDVIIDEDYAKEVCAQYNYMSIPYTRITNALSTIKPKNHKKWEFDICQPSHSLQGILVLFKERGLDFNHKTEKYYNPTIEKVSIMIDGSPHQLYRGGLLSRDTFPEIKKYYKGDVNLGEFVTTKFALWIDMRSSISNTLHGTGRRVKGNIQLQIEKVEETSGDLDSYIFVMQDALINIQDGRVKNIEK